MVVEAAAMVVAVVVVAAAAVAATTTAAAAAMAAATTTAPAEFLYGSMGLGVHWLTHCAAVLLCTAAPWCGLLEHWCNDA